MPYHSDLEAAHHRIRALEDELKTKKSKEKPAKKKKRHLSAIWKFLVKRRGFEYIGRPGFYGIVLAGMWLLACTYGTAYGMYEQKAHFAIESSTCKAACWDHFIKNRGIDQLIDIDYINFTKIIRKTKVQFNSLGESKKLACECALTELGKIAYIFTDKPESKLLYE